MIMCLLKHLLVASSFLYLSDLPLKGKKSFALEALSPDWMLSFATLEVSRIEFREDFCSG